MSVDFYISYPGGTTVTSLNMANVNAADLLDWVGIGSETLWRGLPVPAKEIAPLCRRRLWDVPRNWDPELPDRRDGHVIYCGRPAGYLREKTWEFLLICEQALAKDPDATIYWG